MRLDAASMQSRHENERAWTFLMCEILLQPFIIAKGISYARIIIIIAGENVF